MAPGTISDTKIADAGNLLGLLLAGVAGVFGFLGLTGDEVTSVLRNEQESPMMWLFALVTLTAVAGVVSIFTTQFLCRSFAAFVVLAAGALVPATLVVIDLAGGTETVDTIAIVATIGLGFGALVALVATIGTAERTRKGAVGDTTPAGFVRAQPVLLVAAVLLLSAAIASGVRIEVRSQAATTHVRLDPDLVRAATETDLTLHIAASKLSADEVVSVAVYGVPTGALYDHSVSQPCRATKCELVAGYVLTATTKGEVDDEVKLPIDDTTFEHLAFVAYPCTSHTNNDTVNPNECGKQTDEQKTFADLHLIRRA